MKRLLLILLISACHHIAEGRMRVVELSLLAPRHSYETGAIFDQWGNELGSFIGTFHSVSIPSIYYPQLPNAVFTHTHPYGGLNSLSPEDLYTASIFNLSEVRAVSFSYKDNKPVLCRAWRITVWPWFNVDDLHRQIKIKLTGSMGASRQEALLETWTKELAQKESFGYECKEISND